MKHIVQAVLATCIALIPSEALATTYSTFGTISWFSVDLNTRSDGWSNSALGSMYVGSRAIFWGSTYGCSDIPVNYVLALWEAYNLGESVNVTYYISGSYRCVYDLQIGL